VGFAIAKIIGSLFIDLTISQVRTHGAETHTKISAFLIASSNFPEILSGLVVLSMANFSLFKSVLDFATIHLESHTVI